MKKLVRNIIIGVAIFIFALILVLNTLVVVQAGNVRVLTQFGRTVGVTFQPGIHIKIPFIQNTVNYLTRQVTYSFYNLHCHICIYGDRQLFLL